MLNTPSKNDHMKYSRIILAFFILLTISCSNKAEVRAIKAKGAIQAQGITTYMYGTHVLKDDEGKTVYALRSSSVTLDDYVGKDVEIVGSKVEGYPVDGGPDLLEVSKIK